MNEIKLVFANVSRSLRPGGWFAFDAATIYALSEKWVGAETMDDNDVFEIHQAAYDSDRRINTKVITVFARTGELFGRFQEIHEESFFETEEIEAALGEAGFGPCCRFNGYHLNEPDGKSVRILYLTQKQISPNPEINTFK